MNDYTYAFVAIAVYLISTIAVVYFTLHARFIDALAEAISKALDTDAETERPTLHELAVSLCRSSHCHYFDGFTCTRSNVITDDEQCPCDIDGANK